MQRLATSSCLAGALILLALPAFAQTEPPAQTELSQTEPSQTEPSQKEAAPPTEPVAKPEPAEKSETAAPPEQRANAEPSVEAFIARLDIATRAIHENSKGDPALMRQGCRDLLNQLLDLDTMAQTVNVEIWGKMTASQRETFRAAFEYRMISSCVQQFGGYEGQNMRLAGVRTPQAGIMLATIRVGPQADAKLVTWRLQSFGPGSLRAVDVITEGRSVIGDARIEFAAVLQSVNGDIEALISFMQR